MSESKDYNKMFEELEASLGRADVNPAAIGDAPVISGDDDIVDHGPIVEDHGDHHHHEDGTVHGNPEPSEGGGAINIEGPFLLLQFQYEPTEEEGLVNIAGMQLNGGNGMPEDRDAFIAHLKAALNMLEGPNNLVKGE